jgi:hypothetical protein
MKINYNIFAALIVGSLVFVSCAEGDNVYDDIVAQEQRGAVLRTINVTSNELPIGVADGFFGVDLEVQDQEQGTLVQSIEVFASFIDNTPDNGKGASSSEAMLETLDTGGFTISEVGLPSFSYSVTLPTLLSSTGVSEDDIDGGDQFGVRFELVLSDGRRFSNGQNSGTLTGSYFSSPFLYTATIVCPPTPPATGDWVFNMTDAYGDGWNGASLLVTLDGVETNLFVDGDEGAESIENFPVPAGAQAISIQYVSGAWDGEVGFTVTSANGNVILTQTAYTTNASAGVELINYCVKNF